MYSEQVVDINSWTEHTMDRWTQNRLHR